MIAFLNWALQHPVWFTVLLFVEYVVSMKIYALSHEKPIVGNALAVWFLPQDWLVNLFAMSIITFDPPASITEVVTTRMSRYKREYFQMDRSIMTYREKYHLWLGVNVCKLLNYFAYNGRHC